MNAFMHLSEKETSDKALIQALKSDHIISNINENHTLLPLSSARVLHQLIEDKPPLVPLSEKRRSSFNGIAACEENQQSNGNVPNQWSEKIKKENDAKERPSGVVLPPIKARPQSQQVMKKNYPNDQHRNRLFNPITHQRQSLPAIKEKPKAWRF